MHHNIQMQMKLNFIKWIWVWHVTLMQAYIYLYRMDKQNDADYCSALTQNRYASRTRLLTNKRTLILKITWEYMDTCQIIRQNYGANYTSPDPVATITKLEGRCCVRNFNLQDKFHLWKRSTRFNPAICIIKKKKIK